MSLSIPTYRLRDVAETVKAYRANFDFFEHRDVPIVVFDDSSKEVQERDYASFASKVPANTFYVGPEEKNAVLEQLVKKLGPEHQKALQAMFRPSYGGNRNWTEIYTLGNLFVSADDDMRPHGLHHQNQLALDEKEVLRGTYVDKKDPKKEIDKKEDDLLRAYLEVLGKKLSQISANYKSGSTLKDSATDHLTNVTTGRLEPNRVALAEDVLHLSLDAHIVTAQTYRSGSADVDAIDYANDFLITPENAFINDMSFRYVLQGFHPCITKTNWRLDCGVSSYDNRNGLPPFLPTRLRFEDYGFRVWLQHPDLAAAHVNAVQTHYKNPYGRDCLARDIWNEEMTAFLKPLLRVGAKELNPTSILFEVEPIVNRSDAEHIVLKGRHYFQETIRRASEEVNNPHRDQYERDRDTRYFAGFASDLYEAFAGFNIPLFQTAMQETVNKEIQTIQATMALWPAVLDAVHQITRTSALPTKRVK